MNLIHVAYVRMQYIYICTICMWYVVYVVCMYVCSVWMHVVYVDMMCECMYVCMYVCMLRMYDV